MTPALFFISIGGALLFSSIKCVKFVPLIAGRRVPGDHCTGSLVLIFGTLLTGLITKLLGAAGLAAALKAIGSRGGGARAGGGIGETPAAPPAEVPALPPAELPALPPAAVIP